MNIFKIIAIFLFYISTTYGADLPLYHSFINGESYQGHGEKNLDIIIPFSQNKAGSISTSSKEDVDYAVNSAQKAFDLFWKNTNFSKRADLFFKFAQVIEDNAVMLANIEALYSGRPISVIEYTEIPFLISHLKKMAAYMNKFNTDQEDEFNTANNTKSKISRVPLGVVGLIIPWNYPLVMLFWKLVPALGAGNTVVIKPSEKTSLSAIILAQLAAEVFPKGVVNIVIGDGLVGSYLCSHLAIAHIGFTGSVQTGKKVRMVATESNMKSVSLELGGKSALIITPSARIELAVQVAINGIFSNMGQNCVASSRIFIHKNIYKQFLENFLNQIEEKMIIGDPMDPKVNYGPIIDKLQYDRICDYINIGLNSKAIHIYGTIPSGEDLFITPQVFTNVSDDMIIAKEEIFGPVVCLFIYNNLEEALERANNSNFGLAAGIVTDDEDEYQYFAKNIVAGIVYWNCYNEEDASIVPFVGHKQSGLGPLGDTGIEGLVNYSKPKTFIRVFDK